MQNKRTEAQFRSVLIFFALSGVTSLAKLFLLASCGTLGRCWQNRWVPRNPGWKSLT